jgi:hypothetical protein
MGPDHKRINEGNKPKEKKHSGGNTIACTSRRSNERERAVKQTKQPRRNKNPKNVLFERLNIRMMPSDVIVTVHHELSNASLSRRQDT